MLESSFGQTFFLKRPKCKNVQSRTIYLRITVNGISKEISTKRKWCVDRWDQHLCREIGNKEDARGLNFYLESLENKINQYRTGVLDSDFNLTSQGIIDHINGSNKKVPKLLEEFEKHNQEWLTLVAT